MPQNILQQDNTMYRQSRHTITSRVDTLISASSKDHVMKEYHVMCLDFCMYSTLHSVKYGEILLS